MIRVAIAAFLLSISGCFLGKAEAAGLGTWQVQDMARKVEDPAKKSEEARPLEEIRQAEEKQQVEEAEQAELARVKAEDARRRRHTISITGLLAVVVAIVGAVLFFRQRKIAPASNAPVYARLQVLDADGREHLMRSSALRVGRGKDNDLALANTSVSRHHAEISRTRDGVFTITELNAGNGVLVNGQPVTQATLASEDVIELGDVRLRFLIASSSTTP